MMKMCVGCTLKWFVAVVGGNESVNANACEVRKSGVVSHERPRFAIGRSGKTSCLVLSWTTTKLFQFSNSDQKSKLRCCDVVMLERSGSFVLKENRRTLLG
jgi:hypothetical protein